MKKAILEKKQALLTDIALALSDNNIDVTIDGVSGEIIMEFRIEKKFTNIRTFPGHLPVRR